MKGTIEAAIQQFVHAAIESEAISAIDKNYVTNRLLAIFDLNSIVELEDTNQSGDLLSAMDQLVEFAREKGMIDESHANQEIFEAKLMDLITPQPSVVNHIFWDKYHNESPEAATDYFYHLAQQNDYIKTRNIAKNILFTSQSQYGEMEITINLSKPEKSPKEIAAAKNNPSSNYPLCALCFENEGFKGDKSHAARQNHRIVRLDLDGKTYGFQYSPYVYYNEHSIFINEHHEPMKVHKQTFKNLLAIIDHLPHYFVGSNADLPGVGGSVLSHDHYQGGHHTFPMEKAPIYQHISLDNYPMIEAGLVDWPMSVIRLRTSDKEQLVQCADDILQAWIGYSDEARDILAYTDDERHNTITPIARMKDGQYEMDLVLRNNRANEEHPDGIFHPHADVQHIKKENIGLIEVMGLAILPPRLKTELADVRAFLLDKEELSQVETMHQAWAEDLKANYHPTTETEAQEIVEKSLGDIFTRILEDAGVFKTDDDGRTGFEQFISYFNQQ